MKYVGLITFHPREVYNDVLVLDTTYSWIIRDAVVAEIIRCSIPSTRKVGNCAAVDNANYRDWLAIILSRLDGKKPKDTGRTRMFIYEWPLIGHEVNCIKKALSNVLAYDRREFERLESVSNLKISQDERKLLMTDMQSIIITQLK